MAYRPDVDGLRAVAVVAVVLCHARLGLPGGYVGVDVFFVISGYLITGLILKELTAGTFSVAEFWTRRVRRIVPALVVVTAAALVAGWFTLTPDAYASLGKSAAAQSLMVSNVHFWRDTGYFAPTAEEKPLLHTWSLAVEEQFYLFVPLLLLLTAHGRRPRRVVWVLGVFAAASFLLGAYGAFRHPSATFYLLPTRAWELLAGALLACRPLPRSDRPGVVREAAALAAVALIVTPCVAYDSDTVFPGIAAVPPVLGSVLLIWAGSGTGRRPAANRLLAWPPVVFVGLISYSLYLWHWPLLVFARELTVGPVPLRDRLAVVAASVAVAVLSWRYVELPFRYRRVLATQFRLIPAAAVALVAILCAGGWVYRSGGYEGRLSAAELAFARTGRQDWPNHELDAQSIPDRLVRLGRGEAAPTLLVWGDSHAMAVLPGIDAACRDAGVTAIAATHSSTAPVLNYYAHSKFGLNERAPAFNGAVVAHVRKAGIGRVLLVASWPGYTLTDDLRVALLHTVDKLTESGATVYFLDTVPRYPFHVPKALHVFSLLGRDKSSLSISLESHRDTNRAMAGLLHELRRRHVRVLDSVPTFLARTRTSRLVPFDDEGSFYCDEHHLSEYGALALTPLFAPVVGAPTSRPPGLPDQPKP